MRELCRKLIKRRSRRDRRAARLRDYAENIIPKNNPVSAGAMAIPQQRNHIRYPIPDIPLYDVRIHVCTRRSPTTRGRAHARARPFIFIIRVRLFRQTAKCHCLSVGVKVCIDFYGFVYIYIHIKREENGKRKTTRETVTFMEQIRNGHATGWTLRPIGRDRRARCFRRLGVILKVICNHVFRCVALKRNKEDECKWHKPREKSRTILIDY